MLDELGVIAVIDQAAGPRPAGQPLSTGTYLALAALNRLVAPCSKARVRGLVEDHRGGPVHQDRRLGAGSPPVLGRDARRHPGAAGARSAGGSRCGSCRSRAWTCPSVALDMTNFATFIATGNGKAPIAQRGKAKQKRADLRLVGLGPGGHPGRRDPADLARLPRRPRRPGRGDLRQARADHRSRRLARRREVVAAYRSQSEAEFSFRQLKDTARGV